MTTQKNKPIDILRDGALKATIWKNDGENGTFYSVEFSRSYKDTQGNYHDSQSFSASDLLRIAGLCSIAYMTIREFLYQDEEAAK